MSRNDDKGQASTKRLQIPVSDEQLEGIESLVDIGQFRTKTALFDDALCLLDWAMYQASKGRTVAAIDEEGGVLVEFSMPALQRLMKRQFSKELV